ncbi:MAG: hypothetical protein JSU98_10000 [Gemmatimonadales bacterium]|nr:MAG: hypothetical protein JSU98_10000 [Gemmatimonadales bacterium]
MRRLPYLLLTLLLAAPGTVEAQRSAPLPTQPWTVGGKVGFDAQTDDMVLGVETRIPLPLPGRFAVQLGADWTFLEILTERQFTADLLYDLGAVAIGGGPVFRNSVWLDGDVPPSGDLDDARETRTGYSLVLSLGGPLGRGSPWGVAIQYRMIWVEGFSPRALTFGLQVAPGRLF